MTVHEIFMNKINTSRGQIVIPQGIREKEGLKEVEKFLVVDMNGNIILKRVKNLTRRNIDEFESHFKAIHEKAKALGITEKDVEDEVQAYRKERHGN